MAQRNPTSKSKKTVKPKQAIKPVRTSQTPSVRIMLFGTFDMVHPGHRNFFKQARALAKPNKPFLIVSLARTKNVKRIKGRVPQASEAKRLQTLRATPEVDLAVLGATGDHIPHIIKQKPGIIALGYDQTAYVRGLRKSLKEAGLKTKIVRLKPHKPQIYKTSIIRAKQTK